MCVYVSVCMNVYVCKCVYEGGFVMSMCMSVYLCVYECVHVYEGVCV